MSGRSVPPRRLWWLAAGFTIWCSALVALYALHAVGCAFSWSTAVLRVSLVAVLVVHMAVIGFLWRAFATRTDLDDGHSGAFLDTAIKWTLAAAFVASALTFGPPLLLTACV
jgi:hypothetical protein